MVITSLNCERDKEYDRWGEITRNHASGKNAVESGCLSLQLKGSEIPRGFETRLVKGRRCRMQLPSNWFHDYSGFLFCAVSDAYFHGTLTMKHVDKLEEDSQHDDVYWEDNDDDYKRKCTWAGYISFGSLRNTSW